MSAISHACCFCDEIITEVEAYYEHVGKCEQSMALVKAASQQTSIPQVSITDIQSERQVAKPLRYAPGKLISSTLGALPENEYPNESCWSCRLCSIPLANKEELKRHITSPEHIQKVKIMESQEQSKLSRIQDPVSKATPLTSSFQPPKRITHSSSWKCNLCSVFLGNKEELQFHVKTQEHIKKQNKIINWSEPTSPSASGQSQGLFKCDLCKSIFKTTHDMRVHVMSQEHLQKLAMQDGPVETTLPPTQTLPQRSYKCALCRDSFETLDDIKAHIKSPAHIQKSTPKGSPVDASLQPAKIPPEHKQNARIPIDPAEATAPQRCYRCALCNDTFETAQAMMAHIKSPKHSQTSNLQIAENDKMQESPPTSGSLDKDQAIPSTIDFKCKLCNLAFNDQTSLLMHIKTSEHMDKIAIKVATVCMAPQQSTIPYAPQAKPIKCATCFATLGDKTDMIAHMRSTGHLRMVSEKDKPLVMGDAVALVTDSPSAAVSAPAKVPHISKEDILHEIRRAIREEIHEILRHEILKTLSLDT